MSVGTGQKDTPKSSRSVQWQRGIELYTQFLESIESLPSEEREAMLKPLKHLLYAWGFSSEEELWYNKKPTETSLH